MDMSIISEFVARQIRAPIAIEFEWDDWFRTKCFMFNNPIISAQTQMLSGNAVRGLCISIAEWLRVLLPMGQHSQHLQLYLDAAWTHMLNDTNCEYLIADPSDWCGPSDGPLWAAGLIVNDTLFDAPHDGMFSMRARWSVNLARFVLSVHNQSIFDSWLETILTRLKTVKAEKPSLFDEKFYLGALCPPSLYVTDREPTSDARHELSVLKMENRGKNPFSMN